jgi:hypothetical protein
MSIIARIILYLTSRMAARRTRRGKEPWNFITTGTISVAAAAGPPSAYRLGHQTAAFRTPGPGLPFQPIGPPPAQPGPFRPGARGSGARGSGTTPSLDGVRRSR